MNFYLRLAFRNLFHQKKQSQLFMIGTIISITVTISLSLWSQSSEKFVVEGFIDDVDYEIQVRAWNPETIHNIKSWMDNRSEVAAADEIYYNSVMFNAEDKNPIYVFLPLDQQDDMTNPLSFGTLLMPTKEVLPRIVSQFNVTGDFFIEENEVLVSEYQARLLAKAYNTTIQPGMVVNLSVSRNSPERSIMRYVFAYQLKHYYNVTIKGIYRKLPTISTLQETFSDDFLYQSTIFLQENIDDIDIEIMEDNGIEPLILGKLQHNFLTMNGLYGVQAQIEKFYNLLRINYPYAITSDLEDLNLDLSRNFTRAKLQFFILIPIVLFSFVSTITFLNQMISNRKPDVAILLDRNASTIQIIGLFLIEFIILIVISSLISLLLSYVFAAIIPTITTSTFTFESFKTYFLGLKFPTTTYFLMLFIAILLVTIFTSIQLKRFLNNKQTELFSDLLSKHQRLILLYTGLGFSSLIIGVLIYLIVRLNNEISSAYSYTIENIQQSTVILSLILILSFCLTAFLGIGIVLLLSKSRKVFTKIFPRFNFFLSINFKQNRTYLSVISFIILIFFFLVISSLTLMNSLDKNEINNAYYLNGSDFRIQTLATDYNYVTNFTTHAGISSCLPIFQHYGRISSSIVTLYGVNPTKYAEIGRWDSSSFHQRYLPKNYRDLTPSEILEKLESQSYGIIISEGIFKRYGYNVNDTITVERIRTKFGQIDMDLVVVGIIYSAPGLGVASQITPFLNQMNDDFVLINDQRMILDLGIQKVNLFLADGVTNYSPNKIVNDLYLFDNVTDVNPSFSFEGYASKYTSKYLPNIQFFLLVETILVFIIGIALSSSFINFTYLNRNQYATILSFFGETHANYMKLILIEISLLLFLGLLLGFSVSFLVIYLIVSFVSPFMNEPIIIPISFVINPISLPIILVLGLLIFYVSLIPHFFTISKNKPLQHIQY